jgi:hypothetical protein
MSHPNDTSFTPAEVDQQIERYLSGQHGTPDEQAAQQAILRCQQIYRIDQDAQAPALERVWQRVLDAEISDTVPAVQSQQMERVQEERQPDALTLPRLNGRQGHPIHRQRRNPIFVELSVAFCLLLIFSGVAWIATHSTVARPVDALTRSIGQLYAYQNQTVYQLNSQTHSIVWEHTFATNEFVYYPPAAGSNENKPFVVDDVLYVTTEKTLSTQPYLYGLDAADGSVLWKMPVNSQVFATDQAFYTVAESATSDVSTLTAHDPQTGRLLWSHQYTIVGSHGAAWSGVGSTDGFSLSAVSDQVLYAVASYHVQGRNFFARYALDPINGSILWHNNVPISGSMSVGAQIVNGVLYTNEYNLTTQNVTVGNVNTQLTQVQTTAYQATTGDQLWQTAEMTAVQPANSGFTPMISGGLLYYQTFSTATPYVATLHALSIANGSQRWTHQTVLNYGGISGISLDGNSIYFEASQASGSNVQLNIVALNAQTGAVRWSTPVPFEDGSERIPTPVPHDASQPVGASSAMLEIIDMDPVLSNGAVYYSVAGNKVAVLQPSDGKILAPFWIDKTSQTTVNDRMELFVYP